MSSQRCTEYDRNTQSVCVTRANHASTVPSQFRWTTRQCLYRRIVFIRLHKGSAHRPRPSSRSDEHRGYLSLHPRLPNPRSGICDPRRLRTQICGAPCASLAIGTHHTTATEPPLLCLCIGGMLRSAARHATHVLCERCVARYYMVCSAYAWVRCGMSFDCTTSWLLRI